MPTTIRPATASDAESIGRLVAEFQGYLRSLGDRTEFDFGAVAYLRDGFGSDPAFAGFVAESDRTVIGYALYHFGYDTDRGRRIMHLVDLYVQDAWRQKGIGKQLMQCLAEVGRAREVEFIVWSLFKPNALARRFYEQLGATYLTTLDFMALDIRDRRPE